MMQCKKRFCPGHNQDGWPCDDGRVLVPHYQKGEFRFAEALVEVDFVPEAEVYSISTLGQLALRIRAFVWDESGQAYACQATTYGEKIWESFFDDEVDYTLHPEEFIRHDALPIDKSERCLQTLDDSIEVWEHCGMNRALWVNCKDDFKTRSPAGKDRAAGTTEAVLVRQKKLDFKIRIWLVSDGEGRFRDLYAVAWDIRGVYWDYTKPHDFFEGPLVAKLSTITHFGSGWPERFSAVERECPDPIYQSVRVKEAQ